MPNMRRRWVVCVVVAVIVIALLVVGGVRVNSWLDPFDDQRFDPTAWAADEYERGPMTREAIRHIPPGTRKERVRELLGKPDPRWADASDAEDWTYYIGSWSGLGPYNLDSAFVYVHFDRDGRVVSAQVGGG